LLSGISGIALLLRGVGRSFNRATNLPFAGAALPSLVFYLTGIAFSEPRMDDPARADQRCSAECPISVERRGHWRQKQSFEEELFDV
jgi:hypothetical protein